MGNGIAHAFAQKNYSVTIVDISEDSLERAISTISKNLDRMVAKEKITNDDKANTLNNIKTTTDFEFGVKDSDLVVEAATENVDLKLKIFKDLDSLCKKDTILATNTSSISITQIANETNRKDKVIGMHFMNPVPIMKLVELIKGEDTSNNTINYILEISKDINKIPVECNDSPGFVSNRILMPMINEAAHCYNEGVASVESIDQIMKLGMGHPMGPLMLADLIGIDVCIYILEILYNDFNNEKYKPSEILIKMASNNELGKKTGKGFYNYEF